jgi:hypothetical protein
MAISRSISSSSSVTPRLRPASGGQSPSLFDKVSADLIPFATYLRGIFRFYRSREVSDTQQVRFARESPSSRADSHPRKGIGVDGHGVQRRWVTGVPALGPKARRRIARGNENLPVEILRLISDWFAVLEERETVPGTSLGMMIATIPMLEDSLSCESAHCT